MTPRGRLRFTSEGLAWFLAAAILGVMGWLKSLNLLLLLTYSMLAISVLNGTTAWIHTRRVSARRGRTEPVFAGEETRLTIEVLNGGSNAASVDIRDGNAVWHANRLQPGERVECEDLRRFEHRGRVPLAPIMISSAFPFGLLRYDYEQPDPDSIVVLPALGEADADGLRSWVLRHSGTEGQSRKVLRRTTNELADVRGVRPYRHGDSYRTIHWRSSARRRTLMVREYDAAPSPELVIVVEPWLPNPATDRDRANLEVALSLAATVFQVWRHAIETRVMLMVAGSQKKMVAAKSGEAAGRESLVPLAETLGAAEFAPIGSSAFGRSLGREARLAISTRSGSHLAESLTRSTGKPFVALDPSMPVTWYQAPKGLPHEPATGANL